MSEQTETTQHHEASGSVELERELILRTLLSKRIELLAQAGVPVVSDQEVLLSQLIRFIDFFSIHNSFFRSELGTIRPYLLIGLVDSWLQTDNIHQKVGLFEIVKILCSEEWKYNPIKKTNSLRVVNQAIRGKMRGTEYMSGYKPGKFESVWAEKRRISQEYEDALATSVLTEKLKSHDEQSPLYSVRARLKIFGKEYPYKVRVLSLTQSELARMFNGTIAFYSEEVMCLPSDYDMHLVQHEYVHSQRSGFNIGFNGLLGRALMEAWTEEQTDVPKYYKQPRKMFAQVTQDVPELEILIDVFGYSPDLSNIDQLYFSLLARYGADGLLALMRLETDNTCTSNDSSDYHGKYIFQRYEDVKAILASRDGHKPQLKSSVFANTATYIEDDIALVRWGEKHGQVDKKEAQEVIGEKEYVLAIKQLYATEADSDKALVTAITVFIEVLSRMDKSCSELIPHLLEKYYDPEQKTQLFDSLLDLLAVVENANIQKNVWLFTSGLHKVSTQNFEQRFQQSLNSELLEVFTDELIIRAFLRNPTDKLLAEDCVTILITPAQTQITQESAETYVAAWEQLRVTYLEKDIYQSHPSDLINFAITLFQCIKCTSNQELKDGLLHDIRGLIEAIDGQTSQLSQAVLVKKEWLEESLGDLLDS